MNAPARATPPVLAAERRTLLERRSRLWWSVLYGGFRPRRRQAQRRHGDRRHHWVDWHSPLLLAVSIGILLLCVADAFITLILLGNGAVELNPVMAAFVGMSARAFTVFKMGMTGLSVLFLVVLSRYRFMRIVRVELLLYLVLAGYAGLVAYEIWIFPERFSLFNL